MIYFASSSSEIANDLSKASGEECDKNVNGESVSHKKKIFFSLTHSLDGVFIYSFRQSPSHSQEDVNSPSDNKEEDEGSEDESDERMDQASYDPERLKAFNVSLRVLRVKVMLDGRHVTNPTHFPSSTDVRPTLR